MGQITARVSDEVEAMYTRWAAEEKMQRSDLVRQVLIEGAEARSDGRASFARPEVLGPADATRVLTKVDQQTTEMERVFRELAKQHARFARLTSEDTRMVSEARQAIVNDITERVREAMEIIVREQVRSRDAVLASGTELSATLVGLIADLPVFTEIRAGLARNEELARQPRKSLHIHFAGQDMTLREASAWLAGGSTIIVVVLLMLIKLIPSFGDRLEGGLLARGDGAVCRMLDYQYDAQACVVTQHGPTVTATATVRQVRR